MKIIQEVYYQLNFDTLGMAGRITFDHAQHES